MYLYDAGRRREARARLGALTFPPEVQRQWQRWSRSEFYFAYRGLFHAAGLRRPVVDELAHGVRRLGRVARRLVRA